MLLKQFAITASIATVSLAQSLPDLNGALTGNSQLKQLTKLLSGFPDLVSSLSAMKDITLLAPSDGALGALLNSSAGMAAASDPGAITALLTYHVLMGTTYASQIMKTPAFVPTLLSNTSYANVTGGQRVEAIKTGSGVSVISGLLENSTVIQADQNFTGGTIHVINKVLTVPETVSSTLINANLSSLYGALKAANLLSTVDGLGDVTIFAPNNKAFEAIGSAIPSLTTETLSQILTYHVTKGSAPVYSSDIKNGTVVKTVNGESVTLHVQGSNVFVNGAKVITPDVLVAGGVVHVIDNVLNPGNATATAPSGVSTGAVAFSGASSVSTAPYTSGVMTPTMSVGGEASQATSTSKGGAAMPANTGAIGFAALVGAGAMLANL